MSSKVFGIGAVSQNLENAQYHAVSINGTIADNNTEALGIIVNKPRLGENGSVEFSGITRYRAGAAVSAGARLKVVSSGWLEAVGSGDLAVGTNLEAVSSGGIGEGIFNFAGAKSNTGA